MIISLKEYKDEILYYSLFDVLIKKVATNRELYLEDLDIAPTTYKRCKRRESKKGRLIISKLANHFGYKIPTEEFINELEDRFNKIYHNIYYKIESKFEQDIQYLDELLKEKTLLNPIIKLIKLFILFNSLDDTKVKMNENKELFDEVKEFTPFYNNDLLELYEIFNILTTDNIDDNMIVKEYKNELCCTALSSRLFKMERYIDCLYLCKKIKQKFIHDENFNRIFFINLSIMVCYNFVGEYKLSYELSYKQCLTLESLTIDNYYAEISEFHYLIACLGLGKYQEIIDILDYRAKYSMKEILILLIAKYKKSVDEYYEIYNFLMNIYYSDKTKIFLSSINELVINKKIEVIDNIFNKELGITRPIINILKKMFSPQLIEN